MGKSGAADPLAQLGRLGVVIAAATALLMAACGSAGSDDDDPSTTAPSTTPAAGADLVRVPDDAPTIGAAVEQVNNGGLVLVAPGTYPEEVTINKSDVTLRGEDRNGTIIDGEGSRSFGVFVSADGVRIENLTVHSTLFYGVLVTGMHDENGPLAHGGPGYTELNPEQFPPVERFAINHVTAYNNGLYGIYAFNARHGTITDSYASGSADSGFYVGQCEECDILVTANVAERNAVGFENANASDSVMVAGNRFSGNRIGLTLLSSYQEAFTPQRENLVVGNLIMDNTSADSPAHAHGGFGLGVAISGGQRNDIVANHIAGHPSAGVVLSNAEDIPALDNQFRENVFGDNGVDVADTSATRAPTAGTCFETDGAATSSPTTLLDGPCPGGAGPASPDPGAVPEVITPPGISFLDVPAPPDQPNLADVEAIPDPLPATVELPDPADFAVPDTTLLSDRAGTP
ncbi:right-handed parallel beta-helix repeat-containing protein [Phytoactinopolyspora limicola]|uniref:right-handed parallel beta-helix repeat-containing protein n=1 Tax=Phytoactinopolyspora limicola TaxID=2715536 RepID=UPI00140D2873|nr:NosD domain-containing protein [Phytoactinopolyspora limicola]